MNGYTRGRSPSSASGKHSSDSPTPFPGNHSSVPCLPTCTIASAAQPPSATGARQPSVEGRVVMRRRKIRRVVDRVGIHAVAARRLERDDRVAEGHGREQVVMVIAPWLFRDGSRRTGGLGGDLLVNSAVRAAQRVATVGWHSPPLFHAFPRRGRQRTEHGAVSPARETLGGRGIRADVPRRSCRARAAPSSMRRSSPAPHRSNSHRGASPGAVSAGWQAHRGRRRFRLATPSRTSSSARRRHAHPGEEADLRRARRAAMPAMRPARS